MTPEEASVFAQVTRERVTVLETHFEEHQARMNKNLEKIWARLDTLAKRPTWGVVMALSLMASLIGILLTALLR